MKKRLPGRFTFYLFSLLSAMPFVSIFSIETDLYFVQKSSRSEFIEETGSISPLPYFDTAMGSRISYIHQTPETGLGASFFLRRFMFQAQFSSSIRSSNKGSGRDEDFYMLPGYSGTHTPKYDYQKLKVEDTAHTYYGTWNFADSRSDLKTHTGRTETAIRYYLNGRPESSGGFYMKAGLNYDYRKYEFQNTLQLFQRSSQLTFVYLTGPTLKFRMETWEYALGAGYTFKKNKHTFDASFLPLLSFSNAEDEHIYRLALFYMGTKGNGFNFKLNYKYLLNSSFFAGIGIEQQRVYQKGVMGIRGGTTRYEYAATIFRGYSRIYLNEKEGTLSFMVGGKLKLFN